MGKAFQLHVGHRIFDLPDFVKRCLPSEYDSPEPYAPVHFDGAAVHAVCLRAQVQRGIGKMLLQHRHNTDVLHDKAVYGIALKVVNIFDELLYVVVVERDVQGTEQALVRIFFFQFDNLLVFILIKIIGLDSQ